MKTLNKIKNKHVLFWQNHDQNKKTTVEKGIKTKLRANVNSFVKLGTYSVLFKRIVNI